MLKYLLGGVAAYLGYEYWKKYKLAAGPTGGFTMIPGHLYNVNYAGAPGVPPTQAQVQAALNASAPAIFDVVTAPYPSAVAGNFVVGMVYVGPTQAQVAAATLLNGFAKPNSMVVNAVQDMGAAPVIATSATAVAAAA